MTGHLRDLTYAPPTPRDLSRARARLLYDQTYPALL